MAKINYGSYSFQPIGVVRTAARYRYEEPRQAVFSPTTAQIVLNDDPRLIAALSDLAGFQRIWVVAVFHLNINEDRTPNWNEMVRPPVSRDNRKYGVFSTRSPHRPNPIALSCVEIDHIERNVIHLKSCDLLDGTPVLDIKPYIPQVDAFPESAAGWRDLIPTDGYSVEYSPTFLPQAQFLRENGAPDMVSFCKIQLSQNPLDHTRKRIVRREDGTCGIGCRTWQVVYTVNEAEKTVSVERIESHYSHDDLIPGAEDIYGDKELHRNFLARFPRGGNGTIDTKNASNGTSGQAES